MSASLIVPVRKNQSILLSDLLTILNWIIFFAICENMNRLKLETSFRKDFHPVLPFTFFMIHNFSKVFSNNFFFIFILPSWLMQPILDIFFTNYYREFAKGVAITAGSLFFCIDFSRFCLFAILRKISHFAGLKLDFGL